MTDLSGPLADLFVNALCIEAMHLVLRRANLLRKGGDWKQDDFGLFDRDNDAGCIYLVDAYGDRAHQPFRDRKFLAGVSNWLAHAAPSRSVQVLP
jgi:hypothetical protein